MCSDCKSLELATDPKDDSRLTVWLPHTDEDLDAGHIWVSVTEDPENGQDPYEASIMLSPEEQDQLVSWIQERRRVRAGEDN